ncbi:hypothetical protein THARTR1_02219 [Trichoderma harzianum]|uniref:Uncharacterized protein n=1 Tax=Trichoderma harzianum TaxID=5544 RepID=A0A2K0UJU5_TRIHA|nr:hypothetical protein THARTR1_02219 [Trichoderma harzianum]
MDQDEAAADSVPTIRFTNIEDLVREKYSQQGDALRVTNVSLADFNKIDEEYEWNKILISQYFESSQCMLVSIPTTAHEVFHLALDRKINIQLHRMGLDDDWELTGAVTCYSQGFRSGGGNGSAGSAGSSMTPYKRGGYRGFPTLMIEAGCSWSLASMRAKAEWWFRVSNHTVKTVLLAKLDESRLTIFLERWEERQRERADGEAEWVAACQQTIVICDTGANPPVYRVTGGDLMLNLKPLLLDNSLPEEECVAVTVDELENYAERVFEYALGRYAVSR